MFVVNDDKSIYATRGDIVFFYVSAKRNEVPYKFQAGDTVRFTVFAKKDCTNLVLQKDFTVEEETEKVVIYLESGDTKIGDVISKPVDYWYEVELNPNTNPQTIVGYDDDGPKVFRLLPEGEADLANDGLDHISGVKGIVSVTKTVKMEPDLVTEKSNTIKFTYTDGTTTEFTVENGNGAAIHRFNDTDYSNTMYGYPLEAVTVADGQHIKKGDLLLTAEGRIYSVTSVSTKGVKVSLYTTIEGGGSTPDSGGNVDYAGVEPAEDDMPKVFITGVKPTTKDDVLAEMQYISKTDNFHAYLEIKCQGSSSMSYAKKNFTVKLYSDEARETKLKKGFKDWNHDGNKYVLKANFIDHSHARNIVSARLWNEVVKSRPDYDSLPEEMRNSPRNGAVDGFPVKVYYNGTYEGVYTWNIGKEDWQWGMDEDNANHVLLCAETNNNGAATNTPCNFRALWSGVNEQHWSVEVGTNSAAVKTSLNNLIQFVMDNDGADFRNGIGAYLDIQSAIDYYIFMYDICGLDGLGKNLLLATYDGVKWICGAYDMDSTFGLFWNGSKFVSAEYRCPEDYQETYSLLWERIEANYVEELKARQAELRASVLSYSNMVTHFERFMDVIGLDLYAEDLTIYTGIPSGSTNNIQQIRNFIRDRQTYVDAEFAAMSEPVPCTGITLSASSLTFTSAGTQTLTATVTPDGCTEPITWSSDNGKVALVNGGVVTALANGSATITAHCGEYSASCNVSVSGIETDDSDEMGWTDTAEYDFDSTTGELKSGDCYVSTYIPLEPGWRYRVPIAANSSHIRSCMYTEDGEFVVCNLNSGLSDHCFEIVDWNEARKVRIGVHPTSSSFNLADITIEQEDINWSLNKHTVNAATGEITDTPDNYVTLRKIPVDPGAKYRLEIVGTNALWITFYEYDADDNYIGCSADSKTNAYMEHTMSANTAFIRAKYGASAAVDGTTVTSTLTKVE